jgi:hypothetical protein
MGTRRMMRGAFAFVVLSVLMGCALVVVAVRGVK